jgi:hypothetical protein
MAPFQIGAGDPNSNQDGHQAKNRKKGDEILTAVTWQGVV